MSAVLNLSRLEEISGGDADLNRTLAGLYLETLERCLAKLGDVAAGKAPADDWRLAAHELKGASANLGAEEMADLCKRSEQAAADRWAGVLEELHDAAEAVTAALGEL